MKKSLFAKKKKPCVDEEDAEAITSVVHSLKPVPLARSSSGEARKEEKENVENGRGGGFQSKAQKILAARCSGEAAVAASNAAGLGDENDEKQAACSLPRNEEEPNVRAINPLDSTQQGVGADAEQATTRRLFRKTPRSDTGPATSIAEKKRQKLEKSKKDSAKLEAFIQKLAAQQEREAVGDMRRCRSLMKYKLPKQYQHLEGPAVSQSRKRGWSRLQQYSEREKSEVLHGTWRAQPEVIVKVDHDTSPDWRYFAEKRPDCKKEMKFASAEEYEAFEEEMRNKTTGQLATLESQIGADQYLAGEAVAGVPSLAVARCFHEEMQSVVDKELTGSGSLLDDGSSIELTDEEREMHMSQMNEDAMVDFYQQQGVIRPYERYQFLSSLMSAPPAFFQVNPTLPLVRILTQSQLNTHCRVFHSLPWRDGVYATSLSWPGDGGVGGPSIQHVHWMQRNVASCALHALDTASLIVPMLTVLPRNAGGDGVPALVVDATGDNGDFDMLASDVDCFYRRAALLKGEDSNPAIVQRHFSHSSPAITQNRSPHILHYVQPYSVEGLGLEILQEKADVVICAPKSTQDGKRIQPEYFAVDELQKPQSNRFGDLVLESPQRHNQQVSWLKACLSLLRENGRLIYCVASMNPMECEAVLAEVLAESEEGMFNLADAAETLTTVSGSAEWIDAVFTRGLNQWQLGDETGVVTRSFEYETTLTEDIGKKVLRVLPWKRGSEQHEGCFFAVVERSRPSKGKDFELEAKVKKPLMPENAEEGKEDSPRIPLAIANSIPNRKTLERNSPFSAQSFHYSVAESPSNPRMIRVNAFGVLKPLARSTVVSAKLLDQCHATHCGCEVLQCQADDLSGASGAKPLSLFPSYEDPEATTNVLVTEFGFPCVSVSSQLLEAWLYADGCPSSKLPSDLLGVAKDHLLRLVKRMRAKRGSNSGISPTGLFGDGSSIFAVGQPFCFPVVFRLSLDDSVHQLHPVLQQEVRRFSVAGHFKVRFEEYPSRHGADAGESWVEGLTVDLELPTETAPVLVAQRDALSFLKKCFL